MCEAQTLAWVYVHPSLLPSSFKITVVNRTDKVPALKRLPFKTGNQSRNNETDQQTSRLLEMCRSWRVWR